MKFKLPINATVDKWFLNYILRHTERNQSHQSEKRTSFWFTRPFRLQLSEVLCRSSGNCVGQRRKSYLEKDPELVKKVRQLRVGKHTNSEISKILYNLGYKTQTGKPFGRGMITRLYQQSELLPVEEKEQILEEMRDEYRT